MYFFAAQNEALFFPLLDAISKDKNVILTKINLNNYNYLYKMIYEHEILTDEISLSILDYALALQSSAPKVQAYYHYYNDTVVSEMIHKNFNLHCKNWILFNEKQYCDINEFLKSKDIKEKNVKPITLLPFDHVFHNYSIGDSPTVVLYADLSSYDYVIYHSFLYEEAKLGNLKYVFRYKPEASDSKNLLYLSGYGVEASLKKTDYLVMDDREIIEDFNENTFFENLIPDSDSDPFLSSIQNDEIKPLTNAELKELGLSVTQFVMKSQNPLGTLTQIVQDLPKYASYLSTVKIGKENFEKLIFNHQYTDPGKTMLFINGHQIDHFKINGFSLLKHLREEYNLIMSLQKLGLSAKKAKSLLTHKNIFDLFDKFFNIRFDFRDNYEGSNVILWLNDIENDSNYIHFSKNIYEYFDDLPPGQLHMIRYNLHHVIIPLDFSKKIDIFFFKSVFFFIQGFFPIRFGIVPVWHNPDDILLVKIFYFLFNTYNFDFAFEYILYSDFGSLRDKSILLKKLQYILLKHGLYAELDKLDVNDIVESEEIEQYILKTKKWLLRLNVENGDFLIVNGKFIEKKLNWMNSLFDVLINDISEKKPANNVNIIEYLLEDAIFMRDSYIHPINRTIKCQKLTDFMFDQRNIQFSSINENLNTELSLWLIADFDTREGLKFAESSLKYMIKHPHTSLRFLHNPSLSEKKSEFSIFLFLLNESDIHVARSVLNYIQELLDSYDSGNNINVRVKYPDFILNTYNSEQLRLSSIKAKSYWGKMRDSLNKLGFSPGQFGLLANGYIIGPLFEPYDFSLDNFQSLGSFFNFSIIFQLKAITYSLDIKNSKVKMFFPVLSSIILSDMISEKHKFENYPWVGKNNIYTLFQNLIPSFVVGNETDCLFEVKAIIDPLSEISQKFVSILNVLKQMKGVYLKIYMNPLLEISELSINRFYRYVLHSSLKFDNDGELIYPNAIFEKLPKSHLYTIDYDFPGSWIVTQKTSIYDLDNLLLSDLSSKKITRIKVVYELKYILIEGHAEDISLKEIPAGVQLALKTKNNNFVTDTIIMNNFGYFQFKANPGIFKIDIINGESSNVFEISDIFHRFESDSNKFTEGIILESFEGLTIFPKLIRKPGKENYSILKNVNSNKNDNSEFGSTASKATQFEKVNEFTFETSMQKSHAEINIFSIASGHLYERFLYIMILSVLKHTKHTVKVWFIENFLSSSFKNSLPYVADEFGFQYELITYRWPHWLHSQEEKQRQIWGYKILFLDVLFPLDLDNIIFVDADQIVRTDLKELVDMDLQGAPYGYTPMCDSRKEMEDYRFWKKGYWKSHLRGKPYHISALYVVDLKKFREIAAGDILRQHYQTLSRDPGSLSNLDQDLPNNLQHLIPIFSLSQNWLWCETWCSDESLKDAKTIDLCNNPMTKESKLKRARRQVQEWNEYDKTVTDLIKRILEQGKSNEINEHSLDGIVTPVNTIQNMQSNFDEKINKDIHNEL
ncbi:hypothetical protein PCANB_002842 [Pneumocystis canis]|nr:hypothetical protein PCANB_002842 [Pneumocystis canis]